MVYEVPHVNPIQLSLQPELAMNDSIPDQPGKVAQ